jgi:hypothetical protein
MVSSFVKLDLKKLLFEQRQTLHVALLFLLPDSFTTNNVHRN